MREINLLNEESSDKPFSFGSAATGHAALYLALGILAVVLLTYGGLIFYQKNLDKQRLAAQDRLAAIDAQITKEKTKLDEAILYQTRIANLKTILGKQIYWSPVITELERVIYIPIKFTKFEGNEAEQLLTISGNAPSYTDIGKFMLGLKTSPYVLAVELLTSAPSSGETPGYEFSVSVNFDPAMFKK